MELLIQLIIPAVFGIVCALIANARGRSAVGWFIIGLLTNCIGLILVLVLPDLKAEAARRRRLMQENRRLRERLKKDRQVADTRHDEASKRLDVHDRALGVDTGHRLGAPPSVGRLAESSEPPPLPSRPEKTTESVEREWHYVKEDNPVGPVQIDALKALWRAGRIGPSTLVWNETMENWLELEQVPELRDKLGG